MIFQTERLLVRRYTMADEENFYLLNSDEEVMKYIRPPKTRKEAFQFLVENIEYYGQYPAYGRWALIEKATQRFIGSFMLRPSTAILENIELGYALLKENWGYGFATESVLGGVSFAFSQLRLSSLVAITQTGNRASQKVLVKCGFVQLNNIDDKGREVALFSIENKTHG